MNTNMNTGMITGNNIVLIGMPAVGKSTVGVVVAKIANMSFVDADLMIQTHMGQTLQRTIDDKGARGFIDVENRILAGLDASRTVIATGGSAVYSDEAMQHLSQIGVVVYLKASLEELERRLGGFDERGVVFLGDEVQDLQDLYEQRVPLYEKYAQITVDVGELSIREAALKIVAEVQERYPDEFRSE